MKDRAKLAASQWQKERPDLPTLPMELIGRLGEACQLIAHQHLNPLFTQHGLQSGEFDVLATLRRSGSPYALTPTALYEAAMMSSGGMTNRIDRLESAGLVARHKNPDDRRGTLVVLTAKGLELIDALIDKHVENEQRLLTGLTLNEQQQLNELLGKMISALPATKHD